MCKSVVTASLAGGALLLVLGIGAWPRCQRKGGNDPPSIEAVRQLSELATVRVLLADVQSSRLEGVVGGAEADLLVRGELLVWVDLAQARFEGVDPVSKTAGVVLPQPRVSPPRIDHAKSRVVRVRQTGVWAVLPGDGAQAAVVTRAFREAERALAGGGGSDADRAEYLSLARRRTEEVLASAFGPTGWSLSVRWR